MRPKWIGLTLNRCWTMSSLGDAAGPGGRGDEGPEDEPDALAERDVADDHPHPGAGTAGQVEPALDEVEEDGPAVAGADRDTPCRIHEVEMSAERGVEVGGPGGVDDEED